MKKTEHKKLARGVYRDEMKDLRLDVTSLPDYGEVTVQLHDGEVQYVQVTERTKV